MPMALGTPLTLSNLGVHVVQRQADLDKAQHDVVLRQQLPTLRFDEALKVALLWEGSRAQRVRNGLAVWLVRERRAVKRGSLSMIPSVLQQGPCTLQECRNNAFIPLTHPPSHPKHLSTLQHVHVFHPTRSHLTELHDDELSAALMEALVVGYDVWVAQQAQHAHLVARLQWGEGCAEDDGAGRLQRPGLAWAGSPCRAACCSCSAGSAMLGCISGWVSRANKTAAPTVSCCLTAPPLQPSTAHRAASLPQVTKATAPYPPWHARVCSCCRTAAP